MPSSAPICAANMARAPSSGKRSSYPHAQKLRVRSVAIAVAHYHAHITARSRRQKVVLTATTTPMMPTSVDKIAAPRNERCAARANPERTALGC